MRHDILGEIQRPEGGVFDGVATVHYGGRTIAIQMSRDDQPFETTSGLAAEVARRLPELDEIARRIAVKDLRETYNNGWNAYDEVQEDGSLKEVVNPPLSEADFEAKLSLNAVNVTGDCVVELFYDDEGMFWGHAVVVHSLKGVDFGEAYAELFG